MKTGLLVHGRHVEAIEWEKLEWGEPPYKLGALPLMVLIARNTGVQNIAGVIVGSGASEKNGLKESEYTKHFLLEHVEELGEFEFIKNHPNFQSSADKALLSKLMNKIICDTTSANTEGEVIFAAKTFSEMGAGEVKQITCGSHAPRCQLTALKAREKGMIPVNQLWSCYGDYMAFDGNSVNDTIVIEPPHRGDDPMISASIQAHQVFPDFYKISGTERKVETLKAIRDVMQKHIL